MPTEKEEFVRMLKSYGNRLERLEEAKFDEAVPNPLVSGGTDTTHTQTSHTISASYAGGLQWFEDWSVNAWSGIAPFEDGFEDGDVAEWMLPSHSTFAAVQDRVCEGAYAGYISDDTSAWSSPVYASQQVYPGITDPRLAEFTYFYQETTSGSTGSGFRFLDSAGNVEFAAATDNSQLEIYDANGWSQVNNGNGYDRWYRIHCVFDWLASPPTVTIEHRDLSTDFGAIYRSRPLRQGTGLHTLELTDHDNHSFSAGNSIEVWVDALTSL